MDSQSGSITLGSSFILVGQVAGSSSNLLSGSGGWNAVSNDAWLHIPAGSAAGSGNAIVTFTYDANPALTPRQGTLTIADQTVRVTQAGSNDAWVTFASPLLSSGIGSPSGVAADASGNLYVATGATGSVDRWNPATQMVQQLSFYVPVTNATGVATDQQGNLYVANTGGNSIIEWNPATQQSSAAVGSGLNGPSAVAVDAQGNIYVADAGNNAVEEWTPGAAVPTAVLSGLSNPSGVALDTLGNVYIADTGNAAIKQWNPLTRQVTVLVSSGLMNPVGITVDGQGNVFIADRGLGRILEWNAATGQLSPLSLTGIVTPSGITLDSSGNLDVADSGGNAIEQVTFNYVGPVTIGESALAGSDSFHVLPVSAAVSVSSDQSWLTVGNIASGIVNFSFTANPVPASRVGHLSILGQQVTVTQGGDVAASIAKAGGDGQSAVPGQAFASALQALVSDTAGNPMPGVPVTFTVILAGGAGASFSAGLSVVAASGANGVATAPGLTANNTPGTYSVSATIGNASTSFSLANLQASFSAASTIVGGSAGSGAVSLVISPLSATWTATSSVPWIHILPGSASGSGSGSIQFTYDPNTTGTIQLGTITAAGQTFTITQAPTGSLEVGLVTTLISSGLNLPYGIAVDAQGNLYIADTGHNAIQKWNATTQQLSALISSGLNAPRGVAVDAQGNVYIADSLNNAIKEWTASNAQLNTLIGTGLNLPLGVAVDAAGNVAVADFENNALKQWSPVTQQLSTLIGSGLNGPVGVAVDLSGNVYVADLLNSAVKVWTTATHQVASLPISGLIFPAAVALDTQSNAYVLDANANSVRQLPPGVQAASTLLSGSVDASLGAAVDSLGNIYLANPATGTIQKVSAGFVSLGSLSRTEGAAAGSDAVTAQSVPAGLPLTATADQSWVTVSSVTNGTVSFSFQANTSALSRTAHLLIMGQSVSINQNGDVAATVSKISGDGQSTLGGTVFSTTLQVTVKDAAGSTIQGATVVFTVNPAASASFGSASTVTTDANGNAFAPTLTAGVTGGPITVTATTNGVSAVFNLLVLTGSLSSNSLIVGSTASSASVLLVIPASWSASSNASWLHVSTGSTNGTGNAAIQFTVDANGASTSRTGTLTIAGATLTVTQAGSGFATVYPLSTLVSAGLKAPMAAALDTQGNVFIADTSNNAIRKWSASTQQVTTLVSTGLNAPSGIAVDAQGNVYFSDSGNNAIKEWVAASQTTVTVSFAGLSYPFGVALDSAGNLYVADLGHNALKKRTASTKAVTALISSGLNGPRGISVDSLGDVYLADSKNNAVKVWNAAQGVVTALVSAGLSGPSGVAIDGQGNLYIADTSNNAIKRYSLPSQQIAALPLTGLKGPTDVCVDAGGNVHIVDNGNSAIKKTVPGYLALPNPTKTLTALAGTGNFSASALPATLPLTAGSDQTWLTVTGSGGGVISFSYTANTTSAARTAHVGVLGQIETITQSADVPSAVAITAGNAQSAAINKAFATALQVKVTDSQGNPITGAKVTFTVTPGVKGSSAIFPGSATAAAATTASTGLASAPVLTANGVAGSFVVKAVSGTAGVGFTLTITSH